MDEEQASRFVSSLVKSIQALCNGYIDFSTSIEVIGHIHLNIDHNLKLDYVLTEEVSKSISEGATVFASHSYHSQPPSRVADNSCQKQTHGYESDPIIHKHSSNHFRESNESSHSGSFVDNTSDNISTGKQDIKRKSCVSRESPEKRHRSASQSQFQRSSLSEAKRSQQSEHSAELSTQNFEVIEIKEEPDDEPAVYFGDTSSHGGAAQDLQTPDFRNMVMESLDRVGKVEGTDLVAQHEMQQQQPFPIMMHTKSGIPSSPASLAVPGSSLSDSQAQSVASTSGRRETMAIPVVKSEVLDRDDGFVPAWSQSSSVPVDIGHYMERIPPKGTKTNTQKRCFVCKKQGLRKDSRLHCIVCPEKPGLCRGTDCFKIYHLWKGIPVSSNRKFWVSDF